MGRKQDHHLSPADTHFGAVEAPHRSVVLQSNPGFHCHSRFGLVEARRVEQGQDCFHSRAKRLYKSQARDQLEYFLQAIRCHGMGSAQLCDDGEQLYTWTKALSDHPNTALGKGRSATYAKMKKRKVAPRIMHTRAIHRP